MTDEQTSIAPTDTTESHDAGGAAPPVITTASDVPPSPPPQPGDVESAGASSEPPVLGAVPGADVPDEPANTVIESQPVAPGTVTSDVIDTQEKAALALGSEGGVHPTNVVSSAAPESAAPAAEPPATAEAFSLDEEHPLEIIARIRAKLHSMGQEVHDSVARDVEKLQNLFSMH